MAASQMSNWQGFSENSHCGESNSLTLQIFTKQFVLPKELGKAQPYWFDRARVGGKYKIHNGFASEMLSIIVIMECFLVQSVEPQHNLQEHVECWQLLSKIIALLCLGAKDVMPYMSMLAELIREHGELFVRLYGAHVKPKFHYLRHLRENAESLGACLSCFVTERKHRITKRVALFTSRGIDNAVIKNLVFPQCGAFKDVGEGSLFNERCLVRPRERKFMGTTVLQASRALLYCGAVSANDVVAFKNGEVGRAICFWGFGGAVIIEVASFSRVSADVWRLGANTRFVDSSAVDAAAIYAPCADDCVIVLLPARLKHSLG